MRLKFFEQKKQAVGAFLFLSVGAAGAAVTGIGQASNENGLGLGGGRGLQSRRHLARVHRIDAVILVGGKEKDAGISGTGSHVMVRRIGVKKLKVIGLI